MFHLTAADIPVIGVLILLEGILSIDNALVLAVLARGVRKDLQQKVLLYGFVGAVVLRMSSIALAQYLIAIRWLKVAGGAYLLWLAIQHFFFNSKSDEDAEGKPVKTRNFWATVVIVELTDLAFAIDSILAAVGLTSKYPVIVAGGLIGTMFIRFAAKGLIRILEVYPRLEHAAFQLIAIIGIKVILEAFPSLGLNFHSTSHPEFWVQWGLMALTLILGFRR